MNFPLKTVLDGRLPPNWLNMLGGKEGSLASADSPGLGLAFNEYCKKKSEGAKTSDSLFNLAFPLDEEGNVSIGSPYGLVKLAYTFQHASKPEGVTDNSLEKAIICYSLAYYAMITQGHGPLSAPKLGLSSSFKSNEKLLPKFDIELDDISKLPTAYPKTSEDNTPPSPRR